MKRVWAHLLGGVSLLGIGGVLVAACKHDDSTLFVQDVLSAPFVSPGQQCSFTADPTQPFISSGTLDLAIKDSYSAFFLLGNQAVPEVNSQQLATETNIITVQGAVVTIDDSAGNQVAKFTQYAAGSIYPSSGGVPGYAPINLVLLNSTIVDSSTVLQTVAQTVGAATRVVTYTQFFGQTTGGTSITSGTFEFPIDVCNTCLISYPVSEENPAFPTPNCLAASGSAANALPSPCFIGQDSPVDCSQCLGAPLCKVGPNSTGTPVADAGTD